MLAAGLGLNGDKAGTGSQPDKDCKWEKSILRVLPIAEAGRKEDNYHGD